MTEREYREYQARQRASQRNNTTNVSLLFGLGVLLLVSFTIWRNHNQPLPQPSQPINIEDSSPI